MFDYQRVRDVHHQTTVGLSIAHRTWSVSRAFSGEPCELHRGASPSPYVGL